MAAHAGSIRAQLIQPRSIKELVDMGLSHVPAGYIHPPQERPELMLSSSGTCEQVPVVNLEQASSSSSFIQEVGLACSEWGIFQVINHGMSSNLQSQLWSAINYFFSLPTETKMQLVSQDPSCPLLFFSGFFSHEKVKEWKDTLGFKPNPFMNHNLLPHFLREPMLSFHKEMRILTQKLCEAIFASLDLDFKILHNHLSRETIGFNYYPACPEPELTFGLSSHSDFGTVTIMMQDEVEGLQVRRKDCWVNVKPIPNSFVLMLGDQIEILTNGHYKSVEHRVVTNKTKPRMSIACFYGPSDHEKVKPLDKFVSDKSPIQYKETIFSDYLKNGFGRGLNGKSNLEFSSHKMI